MLLGPCSVDVVTWREHVAREHLHAQKAAQARKRQAAFQRIHGSPFLNSRNTAPHDLPGSPWAQWKNVSRTPCAR